jgi:hypothetical protein
MSEQSGTSSESPQASSRYLTWLAATGRHDWHDRRFPARMVGAAVEHGLIGACDWVEVGINKGRRALRVEAKDLAAKLFRLPRQKKGRVYLSAGGSEPDGWELHVTLAPFDEESGEAEGFSRVNLGFYRPDEGTAQFSAELMAAFAETHAPDNTEYACVHPYFKTFELTDTVYRRPVTIGQMFAGVYWANFLGPGHLTRFDLGKLQPLEAYRVEFVGREGLFLVVTPDVAEADDPAVEQKMLALTEVFRRALK